MKKAAEHRWELLIEDGAMSLACGDPCPEDERWIDNRMCFCGDPEGLQDMLGGVIEIEVKVWSDRVVTPDGADYDAGAAITGATVPTGEGTAHGEGQAGDGGG